LHSPCEMKCITLVIWFIGLLVYWFIGLLVLH
jgi:hypothetical protein